jgi:ATP-dependent Clp protease ATP-binding subunit ClpC
VPKPLKEATRQLEDVRSKKNEAIANQQYEAAAELRDREMKQSAALEKLQAEYDSKKATQAEEVTAEDIAQVVSMWTRIPVMRLGFEESERLLKMEDVLHEQVVGQHEAVKAIARAVRRARAGLKDPRRPMGVFMFLGPTGVGKTYSVKKLAEFLFGSDDSMIRLDMSEFMERHTVARLVGAPPGYVGFDEGGQLTEAVRRRSYSAILLDEIEKAHPDVFNILLQIFDDGHLTDAKGRKVDFRNTIIIMTSNLGSDLIRRDSMMGFAIKGGTEQIDAQRAYERMKDKVMEEVKKAFRPEFLNRLDATVVFHSLSKEHILEVVDLNLKDVRKRLLEKGLVLQVTEAARTFIADKGFDPLFGARPLRRVIQDKVEDRLSEELLAGRFKPGDVVEVDIAEGEIVIHAPDKVPAPAPAS